MWPKKPISWNKDNTLFISVPFTWNLQGVRNKIMNRSFFWSKVIVGGPATHLLPDFFDDLGFVFLGDSANGVLQRTNPLATKTSTGCIRHCRFCAVPRMEGKLKELDDWPDLPLITDNNLLACSIEHFDRVIARLLKWDSPDFNQGLDARLLTDHHAIRLAELKKPIIRLALDSLKYTKHWICAYDRLRAAGMAKARIRSYALVGFDTGPDEAWERCKWIESYGVLALPMWFHELDALKANQVTEKQKELGWNDYERRRIMRWYYQHRNTTK